MQICHRQFGKGFPSLALLGIVLTLSAGLGCNSDPPKSNAELGLNPEQVAGRQVFDAYCGSCHAAYSRGGNGPSLQKVFRHSYLPLSGLPANDDRVSDIIRFGHGTMPGFGQSLNAQQLQDLLAYLHTL
jgi:mono/diheme cytochrome c family protein